MTSKLQTVEMSSIKMRGHDAQGQYAMVQVEGEWATVSYEGGDVDYDDTVRDVEELSVGDVVWVGDEQRVVVAADDEEA